MLFLSCQFHLCGSFVLGFESCNGGLAASTFSSLYREVPLAPLIGTNFPQVLEFSCPQVKGEE